MHRAAIIDLGTNTFHILIFEWEGYKFKVIDKLQIPVKLGKGAFHDGLIKDDAYARGISAIIEFKSLIASYDIHYTEAYGTSALRNASNAHIFIKEAEHHLGYPIRVIDGDEEAELIYHGVINAVPLGNEAHLIMDIGGGSVEFIIANEKEIFWKESYEIGLARLVERFGQNDPMLEDDILAMHAYLELKLDRLWAKAKECNINTLVGASGSFESLASMEVMDMHLEEQPADFMNHILELDWFEQLYQTFILSTRKDIARMPGLPAFRVEMITVAIVMIRYVQHRLNISKMIASDYALKEGIMFKIMARASRVIN